MTFGKRVFDLIAALVLAVILLPVMAVIAGMILLREGRPVFHLSKRMKSPDQAFLLWKFRTMKVARRDKGVSGGDKASRITPMGRWLRHTRLDELPQLWNVIRGDISFVGPRPPQRRYVEMFPEVYHEVLRNRPGITGLATLKFHATEEKLLNACRTATETEAVYIRRCVPRKAALDLIYARNRSICYDMRLMLETVWRVLSRRRRAQARRSR